MPDRRRHRGPHPQDERLFGPDQLPLLTDATADLGWLLGRGYSEQASLTLVCDHRQLQRRQRLAVQRAACSAASAHHRRAARRPVAGVDVVVDGFNVLVTVEAALAGAVLVGGADGLLRDLASMHGNYRTVEETRRALALLVDGLREARRVRWLFDRPVSNSGRAAALVRDLGHDAETLDGVDTAIAQAAAGGWAAATADGPLLDRVDRAVDLTGPLVRSLAQAWVVELGVGSAAGR